MSNSDYGGYAFREGVLIPERSDCVISPNDTEINFEGSIKAFLGDSNSNSIYDHVILGDGPL